MRTPISSGSRIRIPPCEPWPKAPCARSSASRSCSRCITQERQLTDTAAQQLIQATLDFYGAGIEVTDLQLLKVDAPADVIEAFRDVDAARQNQITLAERGERLPNRVEPEARGTAAQIVKRQPPTASRSVAEATGQADRFLQVYAAYREAPEIVRERIYLETMGDICAATQKLIVPGRGRQYPALPPAAALGPGGSTLMARGRFALIGGLVALVVLAILAFASIYVVDPTKNAIVLRFGQTVNVTDQPGLYFKVPLVDNVVYIERRLLDIDSPPWRSSRGADRLVVDAFARYRVTDPLLFYTSTSNGNIAVANARLADILSSAVRNVLGAVDLPAIAPGPVGADGRRSPSR